LAEDFESAVQSLTVNRFKKNEINLLWNKLAGKVQQMDKYLFRVHFDHIKYSGSSTVRNLKSMAPGARTTIVSQNSCSAQWETDIFEKLR